MTRYGVTKVRDIVIAANGAAAQASNWYPAKDIIEDALHLIVMGPASLEAATYTIEVAEKYVDAAGTGVTGRTLCGSDGTTAVALPAQAKACVIDAIKEFPAFRFKSSASTLGATFTICKQFVM